MGCGLRCLNRGLTRIKGLHGFFRIRVFGLIGLICDSGNIYKYLSITLSLLHQFCR